MPRVHAQLRHVTDTDPVFLQPEDIIEPEPEPDEDEDADQRARKRRRIETIANQYIKLGRVPLIVSAGLRGPFNNGWKNPWATAPTRTNGEALQPRRLKETSVQDNAANPARARPKRIKLNHAQPVSSIPSPEASRAPDIAQDSVLSPEDFHDEGHGSPDASTAQQDDSGATEFFSVDPDPSVTFDDFESNPFWLKRPQMKSTAFGKSTNSNHYPSPTRARLGHRPVDRNGRLLLVTPRQPVTTLQSDPAGNPDPEPDWMSAASASMIITSPAKPTHIIQKTMSSGLSTRRKRTYSKFERGSTREDQSSARVAEDTSPPDRITRHDASAERSTRHSENVEDRSPRIHNDRIAHQTSGFTPINRPSRDSKSVQAKDDELSASQEQGIDATRAQHVSTSAPNTKTRNPTQDMHNSVGRTSSSRSLRSAGADQTKKKQHVKNSAPFLRHDHVTSPTLASSTGFMYRKVGGAKRAKSSEKTKARPVTFSSPAIVNRLPVETAEHETEPADEASEHEPTSIAKVRIERPDVYDVPGSPQGKEQQSYRSSRTSGFSTQAALMMAQMEFQDGTMPTIAEDAPAPWLPSTANEDPIIPSPAFTPFHKFNATLEENHAPEPTMQDMPISTQDLFATISPFANSTVKKSTKAPASNLRFSVFANREEETPSHGGSRSRARSPTSPQRKPLREKNSRVSFLGSQSERGSQGEKASQESITPRPSKAPMVQAVELPQLDFHTSNGDLDFTDRFLLNVQEMT
jgi:hypothetical protein